MCVFTRILTLSCCAAGRAIVDEVLPPRFLVEAVPHLEPDSLGLGVVQQTGALLGHNGLQAAYCNAGWLGLVWPGPGGGAAGWGMACQRLRAGACSSLGAEAAGRLCVMKCTTTHTPVHMYFLPSLFPRHAAERQARRGAL